MNELYLNGIKMNLKPGETIATTIQANDLAKPDKVQSSFTNTFQVIGTAPVRAALGNSDSVSSASEIPYSVLDAQLLSDGREILPFGLAELTDSDSANDVFNVAVYSGNVSFFDALADKSIRDLDLSDFAHVWNYQNILNNSANRSNFIYDVLDRGKFLNLERIDCFSIYPSVFGKLIFERIVREAGFTYSGLADSEIFERLLIPAAEPPGYSQDFLDARTTNAGTTAGRRNKSEPFTETAFFDTDSAFDYSDGSENCFNPVTRRYTANAVMVVNAEVRLMARHGNTGGRTTLSVRIMKNGSMVAEDVQRYSGSLAFPKQPLGTVYSATATNLAMVPGDTLEVEIDFDGEDTVLNGFLIAPRCEIAYSSNYPDDEIFNEGEDFFRITPQKVLPRNAPIRLNDILPDVKQSEFVKFILQTHNGMMQTDSFRNHIRINEFRELESKASAPGAALDWSGKFIKQTGIAFKFGEFAQKNIIRYKAQAATPFRFGDGEILCQNKNLPNEVVMIEFPFSASELSRQVPRLTMVPIWKWVPNSNPTAYETQNIGARVLLQAQQTINYNLCLAVESGFLEDGKTYIVQGFDKIVYRTFEFYHGDSFVANSGDRFFESHGNGYVFDADFSTPVSAPLSYFHGAERVSLHAEKYLIPNYYGTLAGILNQVKYLSALFKLDVADVTQYDAANPIWVEQLGHFFYVNKISEFESGKITEVELIRL